MPNFHLGDLTIGLLLDVSKFNAMNATVIGQASRLMLVGGAVQNLGNKVEALGASFTKTFTVPVAAGVAMGVNEFRKFDHAMNNSFAIMEGITDKQKKAMQDVAKEVAATSTHGPDKVAEAYYHIASAGFEAEGAMKALSVVERFATAGNFDLARATEYLATTQAALGKKTGNAVVDMKNMKEIADVLTKADSTATGSTEQFAKAMVTKSGAAAKLLKKDITELAAVLMTYSDQGVRAQQGGEKTYALWRDLQRSAIKQAEAWKNIDVAVFDTNGEMRHTADILEDLHGKMDKLSPRGQRRMLLDLKIPDKSVGGIQMLLGMHEKIRAYEKKVKEATEGVGNSARQAEEREKSFQMQLLKVWNNVKLLAMELGEALAPAIMWMSEKLMDAIKWFKELSPSMKMALAGTVALTAAIGPLLIASGAIIASLGKIVFGLGFLKMAMAALGTGTAVAGMKAFGAVLLTIPGMASVARFAIMSLNVTMKAFGLALWAIPGKAIAAKLAIMSLNAATGLLAVAIGYKLGEALAELWPSMRKFSTEFERMKSLDNKRIDVMVNKHSRTVDEVSKLDKNDPAAAKALADAKRDMTAYANEVTRAKAAVAELDTFWKRNTGNKHLEVAKQELTTAEQIAEKQKEHVNILENVISLLEEKKAAGLLADEEEEEALAKSEELAKRLADAYALEAATLGMTSRQADLYAASLEVVDQAHLDVARSLAEWLDEQDAQKKIDDLTAKLNEQAATVGMTAAEVDIYKAKMEGATAAQLNQLEVARQALELAEKENKLKKEAESLMEKFDTPQNKFLKRQKELDAMLASNSITVDVYNNALKDARKELDKDLTVKFKVQGIDAVEAGTAEALALIEDYLRRAQGMTAPGVKLPNQPQGAPAQPVAGVGGGVVPPVPFLPKAPNVGVPQAPAVAQIPKAPVHQAATAEIPKEVFRYDRNNKTAEQQEKIDRQMRKRVERMPFEQAVDEFNAEKKAKSGAEAAKERARHKGVYFPERVLTPDQQRSRYGERNPGVKTKAELDKIAAPDLKVTEMLLGQIAESIKDLAGNTTIVENAGVNDN